METRTGLLIFSQPGRVGERDTEGGRMSARRVFVVITVGQENRFKAGSVETWNASHYTYN